MQVIANLLGNTADLLQHHRLGIVDAQLRTAHGTQGALHHRERGFQAVGQIGKRRTVFIIAFAFTFQQAVEVTHQAGELAGGFRIKLFAMMFFQFANLFRQ